MNRIPGVLLLIIAFTLFSCSKGPVPIEYGVHECHHCSMVIMDNRYGTEIVLNTGKAYMFDAIECMVGYLKRDDQISGDIYQLLLTDYNEPGRLVDARSSYILHSKNLPSPMGMFLTGFSTAEAAKAAMATHPGQIYTWDELVANFDLLHLD